MAKGKGWSNRRSTARGRVFKRGTTWYYQVRDSDGKVVLQDNTGAFAPMIQSANRDVVAIRRIENAGHVLLLSYAQITDRVMGLAA